MSQSVGRVTLPGESNFLAESKDLLERWGADAIRDSDGTKLDAALKSLPVKIYETYFVARNHNDFIEKHLEEVQQIYLMSEPAIAKGQSLHISLLDGYFDQQIQVDYRHDPKKWWEVINRTTGEVLQANQWQVDAGQGQVTILDAQPFHEYTVSFLAYMIWDPTQMYNYITNQWGEEVPKDIPFDVRQPHSRDFMYDCLKDWLARAQDVDVVRFTTFFYHFTLVFNDLGKEKFVDWFGYGASVSPKAIEAFEEAKGYRLRPEDFVDAGYYNSAFRIPSPAYLDYVDFISEFVAQEAKRLVDLVHEAGKEAMMFLGDNWIGTEPYGKHFKEIGLDAVVGSVGNGTTLRMISDISHVKYTEGRFLPYFFPDTFYEGNDPTREAKENWISARRAMMRNPVDRIGYGGYPSLAYKFPDFVDYIAQVTQEFRDLYAIVKGSQPYSGLKVVILNAWGELRRWQAFMVAHAIYYKQIYSYSGILEALSGAAVDVVFMSFDQVKAQGIPEGTDVVINAGMAGTAFSGGDHWLDPDLITALRAFVYAGGGFVGVGEPTAVHHGGHFFQASDILGVDKELSFSLSTDKYFDQPVADHFIIQDTPAASLDFGESMHNVYARFADTEIIEYSNEEVHLAAHAYGQGRGVYLAGLPYSFENTRLLLRALYYAAGKEQDFYTWQASNIYVEVHAYPDKGKYAIVNNTNERQVSDIYKENGQVSQVDLQPGEIRWEAI